MGVRVEPITGVIGAEVYGVDLRAPLRAEALEVFRAALTEHLVLFFRDQQLTDAQHRDFAAQFGQLAPFVLTPPANPDVPEMHTLAFDNGAAALGSARRQLAHRRHVHAMPPDTICCEPSTSAIRRRHLLGQHVRGVRRPFRADALDARGPRRGTRLHEDLVYDIRRLRRSRRRVAQATRSVSDDAPPDRLHASGTGRKLLYINRNYVTRIVGLSERENEVLLPFLFDHVRDPRFQCRFRWRPGSIAFWDNRSTQHYGVPDYPGRRVMHRMVIAGTARPRAGQPAVRA